MDYYSLFIDTTKSVTHGIRIATGANIAIQVDDLGRVLGSLYSSSFFQRIKFFRTVRHNFIKIFHIQKGLETIPFPPDLSIRDFRFVGFVAGFRAAVAGNY